MTLATKKRIRSLSETDSMPPELRACVHEYGYAIVHACLDAGVSRPNRIHQLVKEIWEGARQPAQRRERLGTLDWVLMQAGASISAATLMRVLEGQSMAIVPLTPSREMIDASMSEVADFTQKITKKEKHQRRLEAAIRAAAKHMRPQLLADVKSASRATQ